MIKILCVCHGNICRSTMCESVMTHLVCQKNLNNEIQIASAATHNDEIGNPPHYGTARKLKQAGIPLVPHRAVRMTKEDYARYDYLIGMEQVKNFEEIKALVNEIAEFYDGPDEEQTEEMQRLTGVDWDPEDLQMICCGYWESPYKLEEIVYYLVHQRWPEKQG